MSEKWCVVGRLKTGELEILATATNITDACYAVQSNHFKHEERIDEIWYESEESFRHRQKDTGDASSGDNAEFRGLFRDFDEDESNRVFQRGDSEGQ